MHSTRIPLIISLALAALLVTSSCQEFLGDEAEAVPPAPVISLDDDMLRDALKSLLSGTGPVQQRLRTECRGFDTLAQFYGSRGYTPLWIDEDGPTDQLRGVWEYLAGAGAHGIAPGHFHLDAAARLLSSLYGGSDKARYAAAAEAELLLSDGVLRYAYDLRFGMFDPRRIDPEAYHLPVVPRPRGAYLEPLQSSDVASYLGGIQPADTRYHKLSKALAQYRQLARDHTWPLIANPGVEKLEPGDTSSVLGAVARRLMLTGAFNGGKPALPPYISVMERCLEQASLWGNAFYHQKPIFYDSVLAHAVMRYQERNGLFVDGILGSRTIEGMNIPPEEMVRTIALNLERYRWIHYPADGRFVIVNIPAFYLYAYENGKLQTTMKVCVGERRDAYYDQQLQLYYSTGQRRYRPKNHETPQIHGSFRHFILNPIWHVPHSIGADELFYDARRDSTYLRRKKYRVYYRDSLVTPETINWKQFSPSNMPFKFKQESGDGNALGRIKFPFDNDFSIYLHDTPMRMPFLRSVRAVSHGCVRIEEPMAFAKYLLEGTPDWDVAKVQRGIWSGQTGKVVYLKQMAHVYLDYYTAWVDPSGILQLRGDIYRKDARLKHAFAARYPGALLP